MLKGTSLDENVLKYNFFHQGKYIYSKGRVIIKFKISNKMKYTQNYPRDTQNKNMKVMTSYI